MEFDFGQNTEVQDLEKVPEQFRPLYKEKEGGGYALNSEETAVKGAVEAIVGLNRALKASRAEAAGLKGKAVDLSALGEYGSSVEEISSAVRAKIEELQGKVKGGKEAKINVEKIKEDLAKAHANDVQAKDKRIEALTGQLYGHMVDSVLTTAIAEAKGDVELLSPHLKSRIKVVEEDGKFQVFVVDTAGDRRYSGVTGQPMTINELVREFKANEKFGRCFESEAPRGSGQQPGSAGGGTPRRGEDNRSPTDKIRAGLTKRDKGGQKWRTGAADPV